MTPSGRLTEDETKTSLKILEPDVNYGQARGYEQAYIEYYKTKTGDIGKEISQENRGNKIASFDHENTTRNEKRQEQEALGGDEKCSKAT